MRWRTLEDEPQRALFADDEIVERHVGTGEYRGMEFFLVNARTVVNHVPSASRMPFEYTINTYRGCSHACTYCFARPTHRYLDLGIGEDFDRKIVVKVNAVERARSELDPRRRVAKHIALGTNTDPYQKAEGRYHLTQGLIPVMAETGTSFSVLTKSTLILRDIDLLADAALRVPVRANLSIGTLDRDIWRATEPGTPPPAKRLDAVARLNEAGVPCGVLMGPVLPFLSDSDDQLRAVVRAAIEAGAVSVSAVALHLRPGVRDHYLQWLRGFRPDLVPAYELLYADRAYLPSRQQRELSARIAGFAVAAKAQRRAAAPARLREAGGAPDPARASRHAPTITEHDTTAHTRGRAHRPGRATPDVAHTPAQLPLGL